MRPLSALGSASIERHSGKRASGSRQPGSWSSWSGKARDQPFWYFAGFSVIGSGSSGSTAFGPRSSANHGPRNRARVIHDGAPQRLSTSSNGSSFRTREKASKRNPNVVSKLVRSAPARGCGVGKPPLTRVAASNGRPSRKKSVSSGSSRRPSHVGEALVAISLSLEPGTKRTGRASRSRPGLPTLIDYDCRPFPSGNLRGNCSPRRRKTGVAPSARPSKRLTSPAHACQGMPFPSKAGSSPRSR